jgi:glycosyltransferase involved in cell wall biosynthesis
MEFERRQAAEAVRESVSSAKSATEGQRLTILFLALTVDMGVCQGDSTHVNELVSNLRRMGFRVRLIARRSGKVEGWKDPLFHCVSRSAKPASELMRLVQLLFSMVRGGYYIMRHLHEADLAYSRDRFSLLLAFLPAKLLGKPIVYEVNGLTSEQRKMHGKYLLNRMYVKLLETLDKLAFRNARTVVCVTDAISTFYRGRHPKFESKFVTVNNGVNAKIFHPLAVDSEVFELRSRLGFDETEDIIAYVGNLSLWQGVDCLIKSAPFVLKQNPSARFMIVGKGPAYATCEKLAAQLGVSERFKFVGHVPYHSLAHYINVADVCVAPYTRSIPNCPIKIYEYLACGKPVVCSDIPGIDNLRSTGLLALVEPGNPEALAEALLTTLSDMDARLAQRENAPSKMSEYSWEKTAGRVAEICESAVGEQSKGEPKSTERNAL